MSASLNEYLIATGNHLSTPRAPRTTRNVVRRRTALHGRWWRPRRSEP